MTAFVALMAKQSARTTPRRIVALLAALTAPFGASAACPTPDQPISTDRPSVMNASGVVPDGSLQFENGITYTGMHGGTAIWDAPQTRLRFGLSECTEFLLDLPDANVIAHGHGAWGFTDRAPGIKLQFLATSSGFTLSASVGVALPTGARAITGTGATPYLQVPWTQDLGSGWSLGGMMSLQWLTQGPSQGATVAQPSVLVDRQISDDADAFVEYIAVTEIRVQPRHLLNLGASWRFSPKQQIDVHAGAGLNNASPAVFVGIGYSWRWDAMK